MSRFSSPSVLSMNGTSTSISSPSSPSRQLVMRPQAELALYKQSLTKGRDPEETRQQTPVPGDQVIKAGVFVPPRTDYLYGPSLPCPSPKSADLRSPLRVSPTADVSSPKVVASAPLALESLPVTDTGGAPQQPRSILSVRYEASGQTPMLQQPLNDSQRSTRLRPRNSPLTTYNG